MKKILLVAALYVFSYAALASDLEISSVDYTSSNQGSSVSASGQTLRGVIDINDRVSFSAAYERLTGKVGSRDISGHNKIFGALYEVPLDGIITLQVGVNQLKSNLKDSDGQVSIDGMKNSTDFIAGTKFRISSNMDALMQLSIPSDGGGDNSFTLGAKYTFGYSTPLFGSYIHLRRYSIGETIGTTVGVGSDF